MGAGSEGDGDDGVTYDEPQGPPAYTPDAAREGGYSTAQEALGTLGNLVGATGTDQEYADLRESTAALERGDSTFVNSRGETQRVSEGLYAPPDDVTNAIKEFNENPTFNLGPVSLITGATMLATGGASKLGGTAASFALGRVASAVDSLLGNQPAISVGLDKQGNITTGGSLIDSFRSTPGEPISLSPTTSTNGRAPSAPPSGPPSLVDNVLQDNNMLDRSRSLLDRGIY